MKMSDLIFSSTTELPAFMRGELPTQQAWFLCDSSKQTADLMQRISGQAHRYSAKVKQKAYLVPMTDPDRVGRLVQVDLLSYKKVKP